LSTAQRVAGIDTVVELVGAMAIEPHELLNGIHLDASEQGWRRIQFQRRHFGGLDGRGAAEKGRA
jgi:hypothetical protein